MNSQPLSLPLCTSFVSARLYRQLKGTNWVWNIMMCAGAFPRTCFVRRSLSLGDPSLTIAPSCCLCTVPLLSVFAFLNTVAIGHSSTAALPFGTIMIVLLLFVLVNFPLTVLGGIAGRNTASDFQAPCRTTKVRVFSHSTSLPHLTSRCTQQQRRCDNKQVPRQIPQVPFYRSAIAQMFVAGFLPFSAISIELHYIFAAVWGHKVLVCCWC